MTWKDPQPELEDTSRMPFGQHEGECMQDVPAQYLHYLWSDGINRNSPVGRYISRNLNSLKIEYPDGIWDEP